MSRALFAVSLFRCTCMTWHRCAQMQQHLEVEALQCESCEQVDIDVIADIGPGDWRVGLGVRLCQKALHAVGRN